MASTTYQIPASTNAWYTMSKTLGLLDTSIHSNTLYKSASKMEFKQFLLLRATWKQHYPLRLSGKELFQWVPQARWDLSETGLKALKYFEEYLSMIEHRPASATSGKYKNIGTFSLVRYYQLLTLQEDAIREANSLSKINFSPIMTRGRTRVERLATASQAGPSTPSRGPARAEVQREALGPDFGEEFADPYGDQSSLTPDMSFLAIADDAALSTTPISPETGEFTNLKAIEDEQIVNTALLLYLNALTMHFADKVEWTLCRTAYFFQARANELTNRKIFQARVDGCLRNRRTKKTLAIVEVKPHLRNKEGKGLNIRMQETGQMAAWISQEPPLLQPGEVCRRLLVSQNRHEIYLTFGTFDAEYVKFAQGLGPTRAPGPSDDKGPFLTMTEYGPFLVNCLAHMKKLSNILLSYTMEKNMERNAVVS